MDLGSKGELCRTFSPQWIAKIKHLYGMEFHIVWGALEALEASTNSYPLAQHDTSTLGQRLMTHRSGTRRAFTTMVPGAFPTYIRTTNPSAKVAFTTAGPLHDPLDLASSLAAASSRRGGHSNFAE